MAIVWFSDEDRERMRREHDECMALRERDELFFEFLRERGDSGPDPVPMTAEHFLEIGRLDIRPWRDAPEGREGR